MNIFMLDSSPELSAKYHCDKHVVKMCIEYAQIMSTVHREFGTNDDRLYRSTHSKHPSVRWVAESTSNYRWLYSMWCSLAEEYTLRYGKHHASFRKLSEVLRSPPKCMKDMGMTSLKIAINDDTIPKKDPVEAYRIYYCTHKKRFATWKTPSSIPKWFC